MRFLYLLLLGNFLGFKVWGMEEVTRMKRSGKVPAGSPGTPRTGEVFGEIGSIRSTDEFLKRLEVSKKCWVTLGGSPLDFGGTAFGEIEDDEEDDNKVLPDLYRSYDSDSPTLSTIGINESLHILGDEVSFDISQRIRIERFSSFFSSGPSDDETPAADFTSESVDNTHDATAASTDRSQYCPIITKFKDCADSTKVSKDLGRGKKKFAAQEAGNPEWFVLLRTPEDKFQLMPTVEDQACPDLSASEPPATVILYPRSLTPLSIGGDQKKMESLLVANLHIDYDLTQLSYNKTHIGSYLRNIQSQVLGGVRAVSRGMCGTSGPNVAGFNVKILSSDGQISDLPLSFGSFAYFLSNKGNVTDTPLPIPAIPAVATLTHIDLGTQPRSYLKELAPYSFQGYVMKVKDGMAPVIHSDADRISEKEAVLWSLGRIWESFPKTTVALLKDTFLYDVTEKLRYAKPDTKEILKKEFDIKNEQFVQAELVLKASSTIQPIIDLLRPEQINRIAGHSEQIMARFADDFVMKAVEKEHTRRRTLRLPGIHETFTHAASSQDCCWWCSRLWTTMSGPYRLKDGTLINRRVFMTGGLTFPIRHFPTVDGPLVPKNSRDKSVLREIQGPRDLSEVPSIVFDYAEPLDIVAAEAAATGAASRKK